MTRSALPEAILHGLPYGILAIEQEGQILFYNEMSLALLEMKDASGLADISQLENLPELSAALQESLKTRPASPFELYAVPFGALFLNFQARPMPDGLILSIEDVTRSRQAERHTLRTILDAQEGQRRKLSKEMHDGIGPLISTIKLNLDALAMEIGQPSPKANQMIESITELLQTMSKDIRSISHNLMPSVLVDFGLVAALENLCQRVNSSGKVQINFFHAGMKERLDPKLALGLYRIAQELMHNAVKHAQSDVINVQLIKHPDSIVLMVEDDGIGFQPQELEERPDKGIGLQNIQTRARSLGGTFLLESQPGAGVLATVEVPLKI
jgi:signal transduction histidine kinase